MVGVPIHITLLVVLSGSGETGEPASSAAANAFSQSTTGRSEEAVFPLLSVEQLQEDFFVFDQELGAGHAGLFRYLDEEAYGELLNAAFEKLDRPMTARELYAVLAPIVAAIRCGHTSLDLSSAARSHILHRAPGFPCRLRLLGGRAFVVGDCSEAESVPLGSELLEINGRSMAEITASLLSSISRDGDGESFPRRLLEMRFPYWYYMLVDDCERFELTLLSPGEEQPEKMLVDGVPWVRQSSIESERYPRERARREAPAFEYRAYPELEAALLRVATFADDALTPFLAESFQRLQDEAVESLILDVRDNFGGHDDLGALLVRYLLDEAHGFYRELSFRALSFDELPHVGIGSNSLARARANVKPADPSRGATLEELLAYSVTHHPQLELQQPMQPGFRGSLYVLMNGGSFSSGTEVPAVLHENGRGTFIGEETGGCYHGCNAGALPTLVLPHSGIQCSVPMMSYTYAVDDAALRGRGLPADHPVEPRLEDLLSGVDTELEFALDLIRSRR